MEWTAKKGADINSQEGKKEAKKEKKKKRRLPAPARRQSRMVARLSSSRASRCGVTLVLIGPAAAGIRDDLFWAAILLAYAANHGVMTSRLNSGDPSTPSRIRPFTAPQPASSRLPSLLVRMRGPEGWEKPALKNTTEVRRYNDNARGSKCRAAVQQCSTEGRASR